MSFSISGINVFWVMAARPAFQACSYGFSILQIGWKINDFYMTIFFNEVLNIRSTVASSYISEKKEVFMGAMFF
jgi:hypothetical protein